MFLHTSSEDRGSTDTYYQYLQSISLCYLASLGTHGDAGAAHVRELVAARVAVAGVRGSSAARGTRARGHAHAAHVLVLHAARVAGAYKYFYDKNIFHINDQGIIYQF